jgi:hypothetical protein
MKPKNPDITHAELLDRLHYDPLTGVFTWRVRPVGSVKAGQVAGWTRPNDYVWIKLTTRNKTHRVAAHRLAWLYIHGVWPELFIDHRDANRQNNTIANLREATRSQNNCNSSQRPNNPSGFVGISWRTGSKRWRARVGVNGKRYHVGDFATPEEAHIARNKKAKELHGEFYKDH